MSATTDPFEAPASQAERTGLAWSRTIIALAAVIAFVAIHANVADAPSVAVAVVATVAGGLLLSTSAITRRVWSRAGDGLAGRGPATSPAATALAAAATALVALWALISIIMTTRG